jgi:hypothetical protein
MVALMMWMTPNTPNLIPLSITIYSMMTPITAIFRVNSAFAQFSDEHNSMSLLPAKIVYIFSNLLVLTVCMYKVAKFGLLPTTRADWITFHPVRTTEDFSSGGEQF